MHNMRLEDWQHMSVWHCLWSAWLSGAVIYWVASHGEKVRHIHQGLEQSNSTHVVVISYNKVEFYDQDCLSRTIQLVLSLSVVMVMSLQTSMGALADGERDEFKRTLLEGSPLVLELTMIVSMLHSVFEMLAFIVFKNDIDLWENKKNVEGLSIRTIAIICFYQVWSQTKLVLISS